MRRILVAVFLFMAPASAASAQSAREAYAQGDFLEAAILGESAGGGANLTIAARALLAEVVTGDTVDIDALLARAEVNARRALKAEGARTEARLQLAVAIGMKGRRASVREAMRKGYASEGRTLVRRALRDAPREAWAHALNGGWNLEVVRRGGPMGAAYFGASVSAGRASFERARALAPDDALIAYQYAVALLELDAVRYGEEVATLLAAAQACAAADAFEARVKAKAARVAAALAGRGPEHAVRLAVARFR